MILFLDIDGVMVPAKGYKQPDILEDGFPVFSTKATLALNTLLNKYAPTIMLTTSHKGSYSIEGWKHLFANRGIVVEKLESLPANINNLTREQEIRNWFTINQSPASFIIIDDDKLLNALPAFLKKYLVLTAPMVGLTEAHVLLVDEIMRREEFA